MSDNIRESSLPRKAGRGFLRALRGLLGEKTLRKARDSARALEDEYRAGRDERKDEDEPPKRVPHRIVDPDEDRTGGE